MDLVSKVTQANQQPDNGRYKQVKISVGIETAAAFKEACAASNVSMASILSQFMADYAGKGFVKKKPSPDYSTKRRRRAAISKIAKQLEQIRDCEQGYCDRIPENLQGSIIYERTEEFIALLDEAIEALDSIAST